jgi:hypothetical protein
MDRHLAHAAACEIGGGEPVPFGNPGPDPERKPSDSECHGIIVDPALIERRHQCNTHSSALSE